MRRLLFTLLSVLTVSAQPPTLDKPPRDVDDALRGRIKQFYDYHVARKYRQAEQLIAEESKDDFYVLSKPELQSYRIGDIQYSDKFTKAKVVVVGSMPVLLPMAGGKIMDMPFASYWKKEHGLWFWYYNKEAARHTPFGEVQEPAAGGRKPGDSPASLPAQPNVDVTMLQSALKIDRTRVELFPGKPVSVTVTNTLPGKASLAIACPTRSIAETGITATFDKSDLKANETAMITFSIDATNPPPTGVVPLQISVAQTNQILNLTAVIKRE